VTKKKEEGTNSTDYPEKTETGGLELKISKKESGTEEQGGDGNDPAANVFKAGGLNSDNDSSGLYSFFD
jgi:hypothetical protein